jgi:2-isopropylmalate synthase
LPQNTDRFGLDAKRCTTRAKRPLVTRESGNRGGGRFISRNGRAGDGPIDAAFFVVEKITGIKLSCRAFEARSTSIGRDAQAEATLEVEHQGAMYRGRGVSTDTVEATIKAILNAANRITTAQQ